MLPVRYQITIGSTTYTPEDQTRLIDLQALAPEDSVSVKLGYKQDLAVVFTGKVGAVEWGIDQVTVYATSEFQALTTARFNLLYKNPNAGDIVKDIVHSKLKLAVEKIENGLQFPVYAIGDRTIVYTLLNTLAQQCGFDFYANTQDKAIFAQYTAAKTHQLIYGSTILSFDLDYPMPGVTGVEIYGESPASQGQGEQAYSWLTKKDVKGSAGSRSGTMLRLAEPTARTQNLANKIAQAVLEGQSQKQRGQIRALGDPQIKLGDAINVTQMPLSQQNGTFKITSVIHRLNRQSGFCTVIDWEKT